MNIQSIPLDDWMERRSEDYRVVCPDCHSSNTHLRTDAVVKREVTYFQHEVWYFLNGNEYTGRYHCRNCDENYNCFYDQKEDEYIQKGDLTHPPIE